MQYTVTGVDGKVRRTVDIRLKAQTMMHDFSLTEKHVVLYDLPVALDLRGRAHTTAAKAAAGLVARVAERHAAPDFALRRAMRQSELGGGSPSGGMPYRWAPERQARVGVMPRDGSASDIRWFEVRPCYVFHPLNAYDGHLPTATASCSTSCVTLRCSHPAPLWYPARSLWTGGRSIWPQAKSAKSAWTTRRRSSRVSTRGASADRTDTGMRSATPQGREGLSAPDAILKHDLDAKRTQSVAFGPGREPGEFVFVPSGDDVAEDDGVVMGFVYDRSTDRSDLVLLDGQTMETVATVHVPVRVPHGIHGNWVPTFERRLAGRAA